MNIIITGGAGFIGSNAAKFFLNRNDNVVIFDNLSRSGADKNLNWLKTSNIKPEIVIGEIINLQDVNLLKKYLKTADVVIHLAAQVAVTTSIINPRLDFEVNSLGTFNLLETIRNSQSKAKLIYTSTNKVYGDMTNIKIVKKLNRYDYIDHPNGINEMQPLDFHSPYGCSKGSADQYVHDYSRIYAMDTTVLRQSCIYGPRQFGIEDQGWLAWFMIALVMGKPITVFGDGLQVRDILYIDDLVNCYDLIIKNSLITKGKIYNIGGGYKNSISVWSELKQIISTFYPKEINVKFVNWRPAEQKIYISDIRKAVHDFRWEPSITPQIGISKLFKWVSDNKSFF
jgi:CDP-paratose 2-epimerase